MNFGDLTSSYSGTSTFRGAQHPRLLSGSVEPDGKNKPYGPKPIYYPVPMQNQKQNPAVSSQYLAPMNRYVAPPVVQQQPIVQYVCNRGIQNPTQAPIVSKAPPTPACSSCGKTSSCSCPQKHHVHKCRYPKRALEDEEEQRERKKHKKSKKQTTPPFPPTITPYTTSMLTPTGMGVVSSIQGAYLNLEPRQVANHSALCRAASHRPGFDWSSI